ncbi:unnamed protein product [Closterium sp. NIES-53]
MFLSQPQLQPDSPLPAPSPYAEQTESLTEHREPESRPASPVRAVRTGRRDPRPCPPPVMALTLWHFYDLARAASPTVPRLLATVITDPSFESTPASALVAELVDFAAACRLDYAASLVAESESDCPLSVGGECALGMDIFEDRQEDFQCFAAAVLHLVSMQIVYEGDPDTLDILTPRSYAEAITGQPARGDLAAPPTWLHWVVLQHFGFRYSSPQSTPLPTGHSLSAPPLDKSVEPSGPYPELVGCLIYLITCTRPDLAYPLSILARYVAPRRHRLEHWEAAKRVLRYLCSTSGMGLVLEGWGPVVLTEHADASWVDELATQRSSQGYIFSLGSGFVSLRSTRSYLFSIPVVRLRSTQGPWLHRSYAGSPTC